MLIPPIVNGPDGNPSDLLRVGPEVKLRVYFVNNQGQWELSRNPVDIPEGWYIVPPPPIEKDNK